MDETPVSPTSPACPACGAGTRLVRWDDVKGFECTACRGHCIRSAALGSFFAGHPEPERVSELMQLARAAPRSPRELRCPDCATNSYHLVRADSVELDVCANCGGLYCDAGEAADYFARNRDQKQGRSTLANILDGADALETLLEIICKIEH
jgi:Zn-finger nucleic acid-binding protein